MNFICIGDKHHKAILLIHGMAATARLCYEPLLKHLSDYYVILAEVDGHSDRLGELVSLKKNCAEIEAYITKICRANCTVCPVSLWAQPWRSKL